MVSLAVDSLQTVCKRYGPGRLPKADNPAIGAGYAGATAAVFVAVLYAGLSTAVAPVGLQATGPASAMIVALFLLFIAPAAFIVGVGGWKLLSPQSAVGGLVAGLAGTVAAYGVALVLFGVPITALEAFGGADPLRVAVFS